MSTALYVGLEAQRSTEDIVWGFDMTAELSGAQVPTLSVAVLKTSGGVTVPLTDPPSVAGNVVRQRIRADVLAPGGGRYTLAVSHTPSGTTNVLTSVLRIVCPP